METKTESTPQDTHKPERAAEQLEERLDELKQAAADQLAAALELATAAIKKHPLLAVGIGFGVGYMLARIVHRD